MRSSNNVTEEFIANLSKWKMWFLAAFWLAVVAILGWTSYYTVPADSIAVVQRFGKYIGTTESGLHFKIPGGVDKVTLVPIRRQQKLEFGYGTAKAINPYQDSREPDQEQDMVTGDLNSARVEWVVQYRIEDPKEYLFATSDPEETLRAASEAIMRQVVGDRTIDEVVTFGRQDIENSCLPLLQKVAKQYQLGLRVDLVQLKNINPPKPVQSSFDDVNNAQQEKQRDINQATGEYNSIIPKARGEAAQSIAEANGYAAKRINEASGDAAYFTSLFEQYSKAPEVTRERMYLETMSEVIPKMGSKIIVDAQAAKMMPFLMPLQRNSEKAK
jgi:modulator of FtsH protease HflK